MVRYETSRRGRARGKISDLIYKGKNKYLNQHIPTKTYCLTFIYICLLTYLFYLDSKKFILWEKKKKSIKFQLLLNLNLALNKANYSIKFEIQ